MPLFGPAESSHIAIDTSLWPLIIIRYRGLPSIQAYADMLAERARQLDRQERHVLLHDLREAGTVATREHRIMQMEWTTREEERLRQWTVGIAALTESVPLRLLMSAIRHLRPAPVPHATFSRLPAALHWLEAQMRQAGLETEADQLRARLGQGAHRHPE
jgi:hypothetical protein